MKQRFILVFFLIIFFSCKKDGPSNQQEDTNYYFEATLSDGRKINDKASYPPSNSMTFMSASVDTLILANGGSNNCGVPGDCLIWGFLLSAQTAGTYNPLAFLLAPREGTNQYIYNSQVSIDPGTPSRGNVNMTISKIEKGTPANPGRLQGTFSGIVMRHTTTGTDTIPVQISGKFLLPVTQ